MTPRKPPQAHALEQQPAAAEDAEAGGEEVTVRADVPEPDAIEQARPAGPGGSPPRPAFRREPAAFIPEADSLEQALPADREDFDDDRR